MRILGILASTFAVVFLYYPYFGRAKLINSFINLASPQRWAAPHGDLSLLQVLVLSICTLRCIFTTRRAVVMRVLQMFRFFSLAFFHKYLGLVLRLTESESCQ